MNYEEFEPNPALKPYIKCIWILESGIEEEREFERIFPDGHTELILHFGPPFEKRVADHVYVQPACFVYGQLSSFIELRPSADGNVLGIRFEPFGLSAFTYLPQHLLTDRETIFETVFPGHESPVPSLSAYNTQERVQKAQSILEGLIIDKKIARSEEANSVQFAVRRMQEAETPLSSAELATLLNISNRELERRFREYVGLSPKQLAKTFRFQDVLQKKFLDKTLTEIAHSSGYYDQSHFIRDFKTFSGMAPAGFFKQEKGFTDLFISNP